MQRIDSSGIRRVFDLAASLKNPINLSIGQPDYAMPEPIREAIEKALRDGKTAYTPTQGILPLRERMARKYATVNGFEAHPDDIIISSGIAALLELLFLVSIDSGDEVLLTDPAFLIYRSLLSFLGARVHTIREDFAPDEALAFSGQNLKLIVFSTPSNPTGRIMEKKQIKAFADLAERTGALLVSDEIYELFDYEKKFLSPASLYPRTITLSGFSKTYSMTGLRLAAATGPRDVLKAMTTLQQYSIVCAPSAVQYGGIAALELDMSSYVARYKENRNRLAGCLASLSFPSPDGAFYLFPRIGGNDLEFVERAIKEEELLLVPGNIFTDATDSIRISYAVSTETLDRGLAALTRMLNLA